MIGNVNSLAAQSAIKLCFDLTTKILPSHIVLKVANFSIYYFDLIRQGCFCFLGINELFRKGLQPFNSMIADKKIEKISRSTIQYFYEKICLKINEAENHIICGTLFLGSGIFGSMAALHHLGAIRLKESIPNLFLGISNSFFLGANILILQQSVKQYWESKDILKQALDSKKIEAAQRSCYSAIGGILSSLGYIASTAVYFIGGPATLILIFGILAGTIGFIKVLFDWYYNVSESAKTILLPDN